MCMVWKYRAGFTLIELLVVVAIITMIASAAFIQFQAYRMRVRDVTREQNMKELQKALELYVTATRVFPQTDSAVITGSDAVSAALIGAGTMPVVPHDPLNTGIYLYTYASPTGKTYTLTYVLETDSITGKSKGTQTVTP